jgi:hypothetical protein
MELKPIQSTAAYSATSATHNARAAAPAPVLSNEETAFFEGLFPDSSKDVRGHQSYSTKGEQQNAGVMGTLVDRKG